MEDLPVKAIVIGVSVFVTMMVLSAIMIYFNTARTVADQVNKRADIASLYDDIVNSDNFEATLTGVQVRSLITKYAADENVQINIVSISGKNTNEYININNKYIDNGGWLKRINYQAHLISEEKLDLINPVWNNTVNKVDNSEKIILEISLDVKD